MAGGTPTTGLLGLIGLGLRRIRVDLPVVIVLVIVVASTAFGVAAIPRLIGATSDRAIDAAAQSGTALENNMIFAQFGRLLPTSDDPFALVEARGEELVSELGDGLRSTFSGSNYVITSPSLELRPLPAEPQPPLNRWFLFRNQSGIDSEMNLVEGSLPEPTGPMEIQAGPCDDPAEPCENVELPVFQTALTRETADALRLGVGDVVHLSADSTSVVNSRLPLSQLDYELLLEISGTVELSDPESIYWAGDSLLHEPFVISDPLAGLLVTGMGVLDDADYQRLLSEVAPSRMGYEWRYPIDFDRIDPDNIATIADEVEELSLVYETRQGPEAPAFFTSVDDLASDFEEGRTLTISYASMVLVGLLGVLVLVILVLSGLAASRRRQSTILVRGRGADARRLALARFIEGLVLFLPSAALGLAVAQLVPGRGSSIRDVLLVAVGITVVYVLAALPVAGGELGALLTGRVKPVAGARRIVIEGLIVGLALGASVLLRSRGIDPAASGSGFDLLLAATPLLVGLASGVVLLRVAPHAARLASMVGSRARGVVGMIGFRELAARRLSARLPAVVILIGVAIGVFGLVQIDTVERGQVVGSWQTVGANYRVEPTLRDATLSPTLTVDAEAHQVRATADAVILSGQVVDEGVSRGSIQVLAADLADYQEVVDGTPADPDLPREMLEQVEVGDEAPIPAIVSTSWPTRRPSVGDVVTLDIGRDDVEIVVEGVRTSFPGLDLDRAFVVLERQEVGAASEEVDVTPTRRYIAAPDQVSEDLRGDILPSRGTRVISRPDVLESITDTPTMQAIQLLTTSALIIATALAVVAAVSGFAITAPERTRDLGYMRAIGLTRRQMTWAILTEQVPSAVLAAALGVVAGIGAAVLVYPSLDLSSLTGTTLSVGLVVDWIPIMVATLAVLASVLGSTGIYSYARRDLDLADVLRKGERV